MNKLTVTVLALLPMLVCSCSSTYVFRQPYKKVVDATLQHCEQYQKDATKRPSSTASVFRYRGKDLGGSYRVEIIDVYGKEESTIKIKRKSDRRTKVSVRTMDRTLSPGSRVPEAEQEWLLRIAKQLRSNAPADKTPFKVRQEK